MNKESKIVFFQVLNPNQKLRAIYETVWSHFKKRHSVLISAKEQSVAQYIDTLLWSRPKESFIPHSIETTPKDQLIVITTTTNKNVNQASVLFNLCPTACPIATQFQMIYELMDATDPLKKQASLLRMDAYEKSGFSPSLEDFS